MSRPSQILVGNAVFKVCDFLLFLNCAIVLIPGCIEINTGFICILLDLIY